jgi:hypothetical protein
MISLALLPAVLSNSYQREQRVNRGADEWRRTGAER